MDQPTNLDSAVAAKPDKFQTLYRNGLAGKNKGVPTPYPRINGWTHGLIPGRYWLLGAESGAGKTTMADEIIMNFIWYLLSLGKKPRVVYYSFEISVAEKIARWVSHWLYRWYELEVPSDYILNRIEGMKISENQEHQDLVDEAYARMKPMLDCILWEEDPVHPTGIFEQVCQIHSTFGKLVRATDKEGKVKPGGKILSWEPSDDDIVFLMAIDHLALLGHEQGLDLKRLIDRCSSYAVRLKNALKIIPFFIQQFSTDLMSTLRNNRKDVGFIQPQRLDFGDSKYTFRDADVVLGGVQPKNYDVEDYRGYKCTPEYLDNNFIAWYLMKNRYGAPAKWFPMWMNGLVGTFEHLPPPDNMFEMETFYNKTQKFRETCLKFSQPNG